MFKILDEACTPKRGTKYSAYVDLFAREDVVIGAGETKVIPLGVKIDLEKSNVYKTHAYRFAENKKASKKTLDAIKKQELSDLKREHYLEVALRSSLAVKGLIIANGIGIVDLDFEGELGLIVHNPYTNKKDRVEILNEYGEGIGCRFAEPKGYKISKGDKVCQCCLKEHKSYLMGYESENIRSGGYGSTGK